MRSHKTPKMLCVQAELQAANEQREVGLGEGGRGLGLCLQDQTAAHTKGPARLGQLP